MKKNRVTLQNAPKSQITDKALEDFWALPVYEPYEEIFVTPENFEEAKAAGYKGRVGMLWRKWIPQPCGTTVKADTDVLSAFDERGQEWVAFGPYRQKWYRGMT